jgi:cell division control protein 45
MAIVGFTDLYIHGRMSDQEYQSNVALATEWLRDLTDDVAPDHNYIQSSDEYRLMAHRHWNLYDAMYHSTFVATRLGVWRSAGRDQLHTLLATIGVSIDDCKQQYSCLSSTLKNKFFTNISAKSITDRFRIAGLMYSSFEKVLRFYCYDDR